MWKRYIKPTYERLSVRNRKVSFAYALAFGNSFFILLAHNQIAHLIWNASPFLMFLPGIILTSWYGGFLPGIVATVVATIVGDYFFLNPIYTFTIADSADVARLLLFSTVGFLISMVNQTFYNQKEEKDKLLRKLEQIEQQKTTFLSMVAHELRTPLATVQLINELLINKFQKKEASQDVEDLKNMHEELESLSQLVQELLQFVRGEQGKLPIHATKVSMKELVHRIVENYQKAYPHLSITYSIQEDSIVQADAQRLKQVFYNILDNAAKVSPPQGSITIRTQQKENASITTIQDDGPGISPKEKKYIFKQYYQAKNAKEYGFGLGLYIARQIIQKHKGDLWIASTGKKGTTFAFSLPTNKKAFFIKS